MRSAQIRRATAETDITLALSLEGGDVEIDSGAGFLDHMLTLLSRHANMGLKLSCTGDTHVDYHHTAEDTGISFGAALRDALGDKRGIRRYGHIILPMDEALILAALDISGRSHLGYGLSIPTEKVGDFDTELVQEFFLGFVRAAGVTLHLKQLDGTNSHHIIEGAFKAVGRCLRQAVATDPELAGEIPSTKGVL